MYQIFLVEDDPGIAEAIAARAAQWDLRGFYNKCWGQVMSLTPSL